MLRPYQWDCISPWNVLFKCHSFRHTLLGREVYGWVLPSLLLLAQSCQQALPLWDWMLGLELWSPALLLEVLMQEAKVCSAKQVMKTINDCMLFRNSPSKGYSKYPSSLTQGNRGSGSRDIVSPSLAVTLHSELQSCTISSGMKLCFWGTR